MSKVIGFVVGAVEIAAGIILLPTGTGIGLIISGAALIAGTAASLLLAPKPPAREAAEMTLQLGEQPRCIILGTAAMPGRLSR